MIENGTDKRHNTKRTTEEQLVSGFISKDE